MKIKNGEINIEYADTNNHLLYIMSDKTELHVSIGLTVDEINELIAELIRYTQGNDEFK